MSNETQTANKPALGKLNARALRDIRCTKCDAVIVAGERLLQFKERATCSKEARDHGTMYPTRKWCAACASLTNERVQG